MKRLILGSQSPRRRELLGQFSIPFEVMSPPFDEEKVPFSGDPVEYVTTLANGKASSLIEMFPDEIILTADTVVYCKKNIYNKPQSFEEAHAFLTEFSGSWQSVLSAVSIYNDGNLYSGYEETRVLFNTLTPEQITSFLSAIHWEDKGGGYTIQGIGSLIINRIEGCYYNVTGLPINTVRKLLLNTGLDLWHFLKKS